MRTSLWFLLFVAFYLQNKCVKSRDMSNGFQTTFQSLTDFIKGFIAKSSSVARDMFSTRQNGSARKKARKHKHFQHHAWEEGEAKYQNTTEKENSTAAYQLTVSEVAQWHGYNIETHIVKSMDGYFLTTQRLTGVTNLRNRTVILHHGLLGSSMDWILLGPGECMLPFTLAEAGYDVWFMNARGNIYSRSHAMLTLSMPQFWDFSFEEMGLMDIPAVIDYIRRQNDVPIDFVAHSMGSTAFLVYLSSLSEYKKYLRMGVLIAPLAFMNNVTGPLLSVPEDTFKPRRGEFLPHRKVPRKLASTYCKGPISLCRNPLFFLTGVPTQTSFTARVKDHVPAGGSVKTILHYMQLVKSEMFHSYKNISHQYNMRNIDVPLAFISSNNDKLAIVKNVQRIYGLIKYPLAHYIIRNKNVSHTDLLWDKTASCVVIRKTLEYLVKGHKLNNMTHKNVEKSKNEDNIQDKVKSEEKVKNKTSQNIDVLMGENEGTDNSAVIDDDDENGINVTNNNDVNNEDDKNDVKNDNNANNNENDNKDDKNNNVADSNDDNNDDGNNDDNNDSDDDKDGENVKDDEDEVTDKETNENERRVEDKDIVKSKDKDQHKIKIVVGKTEGNDLGKRENKEKAYKFIIEVNGENVIVKKLEGNKDTIEANGKIKDNYIGINNVTVEDKGEHKEEDESLKKILNQGEGTDNDKKHGEIEHKCVNATGKNNGTCIDDTIDYGHIFYDGPEAYMDFHMT